MAFRIEPGDRGYVATVTGDLRIDEIDEIRARGVELFGDGSLRWVVIDLLGATLAPTGPGTSDSDQMERIHRIARNINLVRTDSLRLAIVADAAIYGRLVDLVVTAADLISVRPALRTEIKNFEQLAEATAWAKENA